MKRRDSSLIGRSPAPRVSNSREPARTVRAASGRGEPPRRNFQSSWPPPPWQGRDRASADLARANRLTRSRSGDRERLAISAALHHKRPVPRPSTMHSSWRGARARSEAPRMRTVRGARSPPGRRRSWRPRFIVRLQVGDKASSQLIHVIQDGPFGEHGDGRDRRVFWPILAKPTPRLVIREERRKSVRFLPCLERYMTQY